MIIETFKLGSTTIEIDDTYKAKTEEERQRIYDEFNRIGWKILQEKANTEGSDTNENKLQTKV